MEDCVGAAREWRRIKALFFVFSYAILVIVVLVSDDVGGGGSGVSAVY